MVLDHFSKQIYEVHVFYKPGCAFYDNSFVQSTPLFTLNKFNVIFFVIEMLWADHVHFEQVQYLN